MILGFLQKFFVYIFIFLIFYFGFSHFSHIDSVELKIDPSFKKNFLNKGFEKKIKDHLARYKGELVWKVNLKNIANEVKKVYPPGNIYITRRLPNRIIVFLEKDNPSVIFFKDGKGFFSVSYDGEIRSKLDYNQFLDYPILRGKDLWGDKKLRKEIIETISFLPEKGLLISKNISEIRYNKKNGSFILHLVSKDFTVELKGIPGPKKIQNINFVLNYMSKKAYPSYYVDARFNKKIIVNKSK